MFENVCSCKGGWSLAEIRESARWSRGKITTKHDYLGQNQDRRNMSTRLADLAAWLALRCDARTFQAQ
jgi:hypothetical protein